MHSQGHVSKWPQHAPEQCRLGNFGEFYTNSVGPIGHMSLDGAIDRNVTLVPDLDGFELQTYMKFFLEPFTIHPVSPSSVAHASCLQGCFTCGDVSYLFMILRLGCWLSKA